MQLGLGSRGLVLGGPQDQGRQAAAGLGHSLLGASCYVLLLGPILLLPHQQA